MRKIFIMSLFFTSLSCCINKIESPKSKNFNTVLLKVISNGKVDFYSKKADVQYISDFEVQSDSIRLSNKTIEDFVSLIENKVNYYSGVIPSCKPDPEYFIKTDSTTLYGLNLNEECPVVYKVTYSNFEPTERRFYIKKESLNTFKKISYKIVTNEN